MDYQRGRAPPPSPPVKPPLPVYEPPGTENALPEAMALRAAAWQGDRDTMEDRVVVARQPHMDIYAVLDGHGGDAVADRLAQTLVPALQSLFGDAAAAAAADNKFSFEAVANTILRLDADLAQHVPASKECGSTLVAVVWLKHRHELVLINVGDSRAVVLADDFSLITATTDHKPTAGSAEEKRILEQGGTVWHDTEVDVHRVDHNLAMSRAMGDFGLKGGRKLSKGLNHPADLLPQWKAFHVLALPEVQIVDVPKNASPWVWLASDGLWDVLKSEELCTLSYQLATAGTTVLKCLETVRGRNSVDEADNTSILAGRLVNLTPHTAPPNPKTQYRVTKYDTIHLNSNSGASSSHPSKPHTMPAVPPAQQQPLATATATAAVPMTSSARKRRPSRAVGGGHQRAAPHSAPLPPPITAAIESKKGGGRRRRRSQRAQ